MGRGLTGFARIIRVLDSRWFRAMAALPLLIPLSALIWVNQSAPEASFHLRLVFPASRDAYAAYVTRLGSALPSALWHDIIFIGTWLLVVPPLLSVAHVVLAPVHRRAGVGSDGRRSSDLWSLMPAAALAAGTFDLLEDLCAWIARHHPGFVPVMTTFAWLKFGAYGVAMIGVIGLVVGPWAAPVVRPTLRFVFAPLDVLAHKHPDLEERPPQPELGGDVIGIAVSGGGIRSAAVTLGALRALDKHIGGGSPSVFRQARWLSAVSGGAYTAGGWRSARGPSVPVAPPPTATVDGLFVDDGPWFQSVRSRQRYLDNGRCSLLGGLVNLLARSTIAAGTVLAGGALGGWLIGAMVHTRAVQPCFPNSCQGGPVKLGNLFRQGTVVPWIAPLVLGVVLTLGALCVRRSARRLVMRAACGCVAAAVVLFAILVGIPAGLIYVRRSLAYIGKPLPGRHAATNGSAGLALVLIAVGVGVLRRALVSEAKRRWLRMGGVLMGFGVFLWAGKVADAVARRGTGSGHSLLQNWWVPVVALGALAFYECIPAHRLTLGGVYRKRLASTFTLEAGPAAPLPAMSYAEEPLWASYIGAAGPELLIAATAHATGRRIGGVRGLAFTFSAERFVLYEGAEYNVTAAEFPRGSWWEGYPRGWIVSRSVALSGAAFASAMGRQALGTTNALFAGLGLRLGSWIPNPRRLDAFTDQSRRPRVHLGYFAKEILGVYRPETDAFVYVADGGHRENLGLVELLRQNPRPKVVLVVDASGDTPGSFTTLREAIELADTELGVKITVDWWRLEHPPHGLPMDCATTGVVTYADDTAALLFFAHYQVCEKSPVSLKQFAAQHPKFPNYSTGDQFLTTEEFDHLVALGEHMGNRMLDLAVAIG